MNPPSIAVLGAGRSGLAAAALARAQGAPVTVYETGLSDPAARETLAARVTGVGAVFESELPPEDGAVPDLVVVSPGLDPRTALYQHFARSSAAPGGGPELIGELEFAWRAARSPAVAITGTNGKTTTTEMIGHILTAAGLRAPLGANHGKPLSEIVLEEWQGQPQADWLVLEVSSFQLELAPSFHPRVAVWTNFAPDHLDRYPGLAEYRAAKEELFANLEAADCAVIPADEAVATRPARVVRFGVERPSEAGSAELIESDLPPAVPEFRMDAAGMFFCNSQPLGSFAQLGVRGRHNARNALAALAACEACGISAPRGFELLKSYQSAPHRYQLLAEISGIEYINDSKATNLHAMGSALAADSKPVHLLVGGFDKGLDWSELSPELPGRVAGVHAFGATAVQIRDAWAALVPVTVSADLPAALRSARALARPGEQILLSPGTSSFDQYSSYAQRGQHFAALVAALAPPAELPAAG